MASGDVRVVVTGIGMVAPLGIGTDAFWEGVTAARSAARCVSGFGIPPDSGEFACPVDDSALDMADYLDSPKSVKLMSRATRFAVAAARMATRDAGFEGPCDDPHRCGVSHGAGGIGLLDDDYMSSLVDLGAHYRDGGGPDLGALVACHINPLAPLRMLPNSAAAQIAIEHGFQGENTTVCTACTSGAQAIGEALRVLRLGRADVMLAGGSDAMINAMGLASFRMLGVLSRRSDDPARASRPFDLNRDGFVMGEGAAMLVLETESHARRRGARVRAELAGYGCCSDAYRITDGREDGSGCVEAMRRALDDAGVPPSEVDYVNAHGTGTRMNDRTEVLAIGQLFGARARQIPISSTKSQIGHLVAAAGAVELATCTLAIEHQVLPPTINHDTPDPECDLDVVPNAAREGRLDVVLSNSFGFGGQNACLVLRRWI